MKKVLRFLKPGRRGTRLSTSDLFAFNCLLALWMVVWGRPDVALGIVGLAFLMKLNGKAHDNKKIP